MTGNPFNVAASLGFRVCNLGMEANSLAALINGAEFAEVGPGIVNFSTAGLTVSNAQSPKIDGYYGALTVDSTCFATRLGSVEEAAPGGIRINDTSAVQGAAITNSTNRPVFFDGPGFPTMATIYHNPFFDLWTANGAGGPPDGVSIPGAATAAKATSPSYPGNPSATSVAVAFSGTTINNGIWIVPANQPWRDNEYVSFMIPIYTASAANACRVYATPDNGSSVEYMGEANATNGWTVIRGSIKLVAGQNWRFMLAGWNGTAFAGGFTAYVGGINIVRGALPPQTLSDSVGRRNFVSSSISFAPPFRGMTAVVGTAPPVVYYAVGTAAASDWKQIS